MNALKKELTALTKALLTQSAAIAQLADSNQKLADVLAQSEVVAAPPELDLAGRPIRYSQ